MFSLFQRKRVLAEPPDPVELPQGMTRPESAASLLAPPHRQKLLEAIWQRTSLSRAQFSLLYQHPLERYANWPSNSPLPRITTTPIRADCSITGWRSSSAP